MMDQLPETIARVLTTVLYVDDEAMARKYFARLVAADYEVLTAAGADEAIQILRGNEVDILVTDYRMPERDGGDLLRQVGREFPYVVRILMTAFADRNVLLDTLNAGEVFRLLEKPIQADELNTVLRLAQDAARERKGKRLKLRAINETLGFLAHELNTPLASITNFVTAIQQRQAKAEPSAKEKAEIVFAVSSIEENARYCITLLSTFHASVQGETARTGQHNDSTAEQLVLSLLDTYPLSHAQRAMINVDIRQDFQIAALPNCVTLVLSSILGNALRALRDIPEPRINFTLLVKGTIPYIIISDNGPGIQPEIQQRLLVEPVIPRSESEKKGWGLIFCQRIMQTFSGGIAIHSQPGNTTVSLNFPSLNSPYKWRE